MATELASFFSNVVPLLRGEAGSPDFARALAFYRTLMRRNVSAILRNLFPATHAYATLVAPGRWPAWVEAYDREHPPTHYEPNAFGLAFPSFLERTLGAAEAVTPALVELADYEWLLFTTAVALELPEVEQVPVVRHYDHDVPRLLSDLQRNHTCAPAPPRPVALFVYRDTSDRARTAYASPAMLVAFAHHFGVSTAGRGVSSHELCSARKALEALGVVERAGG
jgi:hypothetical protein